MSCVLVSEIGTTGVLTCELPHTEVNDERDHEQTNVGPDRIMIGKIDGTTTANGLPRYVDAAEFRRALVMADRTFRRAVAAGRVPKPDRGRGGSI